MGSRLEQHQVWLYLVAILAGIAAGQYWPQAARDFELAVWPMLALLLYATFTQIPLVRIRASLTDHRFMAAMVTGNFLVVPLIVSGLILLAPEDPAIRLGILLVLLAPCTDWFISFTHLGRGDSARAIAACPVLLLLQVVALPIYGWLILGGQIAGDGLASALLPAFFGLILAPLMLAWGSERLAISRPGIRPMLEKLGALPVPVLALVLFLVAAGQAETLTGNLNTLRSVALIFAGYLVAALIAAAIVGCLFGVRGAPGRTLMFSLGTRNSFVVLPVALALPDPLAGAVMVIVLQSLVELFGMMVYLKVVPAWDRSRAEDRGAS